MIESIKFIQYRIEIINCPNIPYGSLCYRSHLKSRSHRHLGLLWRTFFRSITLSCLLRGLLLLSWDRLLLFFRICGDQKRQILCLFQLYCPCRLVWPLLVLKTIRMKFLRLVPNLILLRFDRQTYFVRWSQGQWRRLLVTEGLLIRSHLHRKYQRRV